MANLLRSSLCLSTSHCIRGSGGPVVCRCNSFLPCVPGPVGHSAKSKDVVGIYCCLISATAAAVVVGYPNLASCMYVYIDISHAVIMCLAIDQALSHRTAQT